MSKPLKVKKASVPQPLVPVEVPAVPKPRKSRAKPKPTKEESLKMLSTASSELKQIVVDLKEDEMKIKGMTLKQLPLLVKETLENLEEDINDIDEQHQQLLNQPEEPNK